MAELDDRFVKRGHWINWEKGSIMGQTFTVEAQTGTLIVALLTILASVATAQLWNLLTFVLHQMRAHGATSDGLYWQQQVLLRTMPTPTAFMADFLKISWRWRAKIHHSLLRSLPVLAFALFFAVGSIAGGISTSYAVDNSNIEVLVDSPFCARINSTKASSSLSLLTTHGDAIQNYVTSCYQNSSSLPAACRNTFHRPNITFSAEPAACPWNETMCTGQGSSAIAMDSGLLDMRTHFGLNVQERDTVRLRRRTTCNVLPRQGHVFERPPEYLNRGSPAQRWTLEYGSWAGVPERQRPNVTFNLQTVLVEHQLTFQTTAMMAYVHPNSYEGGIIPLPEMQRDDADIVLITLWANAVIYEREVNDPLFAAHNVRMKQQPNGKDKAFYWRDHPAGVVGCALQYQFCYPRPGKDDFCTSLGPSPSPDNLPAWPDATPIQHSLLTLLHSINRVANMNISPQRNNLRAAKTVQVGQSPGLAADQWIHEVVDWEAFVWAGWQTLLSVSIMGPSVFDAAGGEYTDAPDSTGDQQLCRSMKMRKAGGFANINVFALIFLATFSTIITVFNMLVLRFAIFLSRFRRALAPRIESWVQDGIFQLQRRAYEALDEGRWVDYEKEIPTTEERERLRALGGVSRMNSSESEVDVEVEEVAGKEGIGKGKEKGREGEWNEVLGFRISVGRVDTSATLVGGDGDAEAVKKGFDVRGTKA